jgi:hypothetical protein
VAVIAIGNVPNWVGVPESTPAADNVIPDGRVLVVPNVAFPTAFVCVNVTGVYGIPTVPNGTDEGLTTID